MRRAWLLRAKKKKLNLKASHSVLHETLSYRVWVVSSAQVAADDSQSQMSGYLSQRHKKTWRRNWFVLKGRVLYLYRTPDDAIAQESMPVLGYSIQIGSEVGTIDIQSSIQK